MPAGVCQCKASHTGRHKLGKWVKGKMLTVDVVSNIFSLKIFHKLEKKCLFCIPLCVNFGSHFNQLIILRNLNRISKPIYYSSLNYISLNGIIWLIEQNIQDPILFLLLLPYSTVYYIDYNGTYFHRIFSYFHVFSSLNASILPFYFSWYELYTSEKLTSYF